MEKNESKLSINLGYLAWPGTILSIALIAIRAFQPNAPMLDTWTASSWFWLLLPAFLPVIIGTIILAIAAVAYMSSSWK